jgi:hypothetical protein
MVSEKVQGCQLTHVCTTPFVLCLGQIYDGHVKERTVEHAQKQTFALESIKRKLTSSQIVCERRADASSTKQICRKMGTRTTLILQVTVLDGGVVMVVVVTVVVVVVASQVGKREFHSPSWLQTATVDPDRMYPALQLNRRTAPATVPCLQCCDTIHGGSIASKEADARSRGMSLDHTYAGFKPASVGCKSIRECETLFKTELRAHESQAIVECP